MMALSALRPPLRAEHHERTSQTMVYDANKELPHIVAALCGVSFGSTLFVNAPFFKFLRKRINLNLTTPPQLRTMNFMQVTPM